MKHVAFILFYFVLSEAFGMKRRPLQIKMGFCHLGNRNSHSGHMGNKPNTKKKCRPAVISGAQMAALVIWGTSRHFGNK